MRITVLAVGTKMPAWVEAGVKEYARRMPRQIQFEIKEIAPGQRSARGDVVAAQEHEAEQLLKRAKGADLLIALDERGSQWSSTQLASEMSTWLNEYPNVAIMIGGPDGLTEACRQRADKLWSLSALTLPHGMVRVLLAEQIYRAWTIVQGHPYHRDG